MNFYILMSVALLMFLLAWLVYRYPMMISGISTMSEKRRSLVDLDKLKVLVSRAMCVTAVLHVILALLSIGWHGTEKWLWAASFIIIIGMAMSVNWLGVKYDKAKNAMRNNMIVNALLFCVATVIIASMFGLARTPEITLSETSVNIDGFYGERIEICDIDTIYFTSQYPKIRMRTNGYSDGRIMYGHFRTDMGDVKLFVDREVNALVVIKSNGKYIMFNRPSEEATISMFNELIQMSGSGNKEDE